MTDVDETKAFSDHLRAGPGHACAGFMHGLVSTISWPSSPNVGMFSHNNAQQPPQEVSTLTIVVDGRKTLADTARLTVPSRASRGPHREHLAPMVTVQRLPAPIRAIALGQPCDRQLPSITNRVEPGPRTRRLGAERLDGTPPPSVSPPGDKPSGGRRTPSDVPMPSLRNPITPVRPLVSNFWPVYSQIGALLFKSELGSAEIRVGFEQA